MPVPPWAYVAAFGAGFVAVKAGQGELAGLPIIGVFLPGPVAVPIAGGAGGSAAGGPTVPGAEAPSDLWGAFDQGAAFGFAPGPGGGILPSAAAPAAYASVPDALAAPGLDGFFPSFPYYPTVPYSQPPAAYPGGTTPEPLPLPLPAPEPAPAPAPPPPPPPPAPAPTWPAVLGPTKPAGAGGYVQVNGSAFAYAVSGSTITGRTAYRPLFTAWCTAPRAYVWPNHGTYYLVRILSGSWSGRYFDSRASTVHYTAVP